jgi:hypothetical protein
MGHAENVGDGGRGLFMGDVSGEGPYISATGRAAVHGGACGAVGAMRSTGQPSCLQVRSKCQIIINQLHSELTDANVNTG